MDSLRLILAVGVIGAVTCNEKIINGDDAPKDRYPWQVTSFYDPTEFNPEGNGLLCGGALIDPEYFISAAHCFYGYNDFSKYTVVMRKGDLLDDSGQERTPIAFNIHPDYNNDTYENDLIIVKVDRPFKLSDKVAVATLSLDDKTVKKGSCYLSGYGVIDEETDELPTVNQEYKVKVTSRKKCRDAADKANRTDTWFGTRDAIKNYMMCSKNKQQGACTYDSGGALGCFDKRTGNYTVIGVRSWVVADLPCDRGWNVYMRVSRFYDFINGVVPTAMWM